MHAHFLANIEIGEATGPENIFLFGCLANEVEDIRHEQTFRGVKTCLKVESVIKAIQSGAFGDPVIFDPLLGLFCGRFCLIFLATLRTDFYLVNKDFDSCNFSSRIVSHILDLETMEKVYSTFKNKAAWAKKSIMAAASMGTFSSDR